MEELETSQYSPRTKPMLAPMQAVDGTLTPAFLCHASPKRGKGWTKPLDDCDTRWEIASRAIAGDACHAARQVRSKYFMMGGVSYFMMGEASLQPNGGSLSTG